MKRQSDDAVSQDKGFIEEEAAAPEIDEAENAPEEAADENTENKTIYDDASDYKFLKSNDGTFHIIEQWESVEALSGHMASSHFKSFSKESRDHIEDEEIKVLRADELNLYE